MPKLRFPRFSPTDTLKREYHIPKDKVNDAKYRAEE